LPYANAPEWHRFIFDLPDRQASLLPVASCVLVKSSNPEALLDKSGKPVIRPYTPVSPSDQTGELAFIIKKYDTGNASKHIHSLKEGDSLAIKGPIKKFDYKCEHLHISITNESDEITQ
jgi:cytochrome-b5 reductase